MSFARPIQSEGILMIQEEIHTHTHTHIHISRFVETFLYIIHSP